MTFKVRKSTNGQYYFTVVASNGKTLAHSETYHNKTDATHAANVIKSEAGSGTVQDLT